MSLVLEHAKIYQANRTENNATFEFDHANDEFAETESVAKQVHWKIDFSQRTVSITVITDDGSPKLPASVSPLIFGVHYCVEACVASWIDGAQATAVRTHTKQLESAILSICFNGRHVFRHDTVWCFMLALDDRYDKTFFSQYIEDQLKEFNKYGGRVVYSNAMNRLITLKLRYITGAFDRPERMFQGGTSSGQPSSQYGKAEGLLFDVNKQACTMALLHCNFHVDRILQQYPNLFKRLDIPLATEKCKSAFMSSVCAESKPDSYTTIENTVKEYGPNKKTMLALHKAAKICKLICCVFCFLLLSMMQIEWIHVTNVIVSFLCINRLRGKWNGKYSKQNSTSRKMVRRPQK